jgi:hypothetical protein
MIISTPTIDPRLLILRDEDNVCIACTVIEAGTSLVIEDQTVTLNETLYVGHKIARRSIQMCEKILKYGAPIGSATQKISCGEPVHTHNLKSDYIASYTLDVSRTNALERTS